MESERRAEAAMARQGDRRMVSLVEMTLVMVLLAMSVYTIEVSLEMSHKISTKQHLLFSDILITMVLSAFLALRLGYNGKNVCGNILLWFALVEIAASSFPSADADYLVYILYFQYFKKGDYYFCFIF